jgi:uncharacterized protein
MITCCVITCDDATTARSPLMRIIDADGHYLEPVRIWTDVPARSRDKIRIVADADGFTSQVWLGDLRVLNAEKNMSQLLPWGIGDALTPGGTWHRDKIGRRYEEAEPGGFDAEIRLRIHDENGIHAAVVFPSFGLFMRLIRGEQLAEDVSAALNRWGAEYASVAPDEIYPVAVLPWQYPQVAARELRRCAAEYGFRAAMVYTTPGPDGRTLADPELDVIWSTAHELGVPVCVHSGLTYNVPQYGNDRGGSYIVRHSAVFALETMMAFGTLYDGGTFDRFPELRFGFMESSCGWAPFFTERLDEHREAIGWALNPPLQASASEVFRRQCVIGCEGEEAMVGYVQDQFGVDKVVWASDFPHFDTEPPFAKDMLERTDLNEEQMNAVMAGAAIDFYRLDVDRIERSLARRQAPTRDSFRRVS